MCPDCLQLRHLALAGGFPEGMWRPPVAAAGTHTSESTLSSWTMAFSASELAARDKERERVREEFITTKAGGSEIKAALGISEQQRLSDFKRGVRYWKMVTPD